MPLRPDTVEKLDELERRARSHRIFGHIRPTRYRIFATVPLASGYGSEVTLASGLVAPAAADAVRRTWGEIVRVLLVGPDCDPAIQPGVHLLVPEFAGSIVIDDDAETDISIYGDGDPMAILE